MNLVDSSGWLEYFADAPNADFFAPAIEDFDNLLVSSINIYEVFKRILQQRNEYVAQQAVVLMMQGIIIDVSPSIAMHAAKLSDELKIPLADSMILATARDNDAVVWTQDSDFKELEGVRYIEKQKD
ncbi:type II toxin-antitoxin system VapC family toxin [Candidatus Poribacteria bacterium]|nr:type II toxin-antitoxin system VapC family toxin [Candidatus Poribacteria bacterium]